MSILSLAVTILSLLGLGALFGTSLYDAVVLAPNLQGGSAGLEHGRLFMAAATPANLFRLLSPVVQVLLVLAAVIGWTSPPRRWLLLAALFALVVSDVITFTYHYPRLRLMFTAPLTVDPERLALAARQWTAANLVRIALVLGAWIGTLIALGRLVMEPHSAPTP